MKRMAVRVHGSTGEPAREKHLGAGAASDKRAANTPAPCVLCALLRRNGSAGTQRAASGAAHGLRIALVADDAETRLTACRMIQAQRDRWTLSAYTPHRLPAICDRPYRNTAATAGPAPPPHVVLIALRDGDLSGLDCLRNAQALAPNLPVVVISGPCDGATIAQGCRTKVNGWLVKPITPDGLAVAVKEAAQGRRFLCATAQTALMDYLGRQRAAGLSKSQSEGTPRLTTREQQILACFEEGLAYKQIPDRLHISYSMVRKLQRRIYQKLHAANRTEAIRHRQELSQHPPCQ